MLHMTKTTDRLQFAGLRGRGTRRRMRHAEHDLRHWGFLCLQNTDGLFSVLKCFGGKDAIMPGADFDVLRSEITMDQVLKQLEFRPTGRTDQRLYGPCPIHGSSSARSTAGQASSGTRRKVDVSSSPR